MDNFFDAIKRFVEANQDNEYRGGIYFLWNDTKISYCVAEDIANMLEANEDYNRDREDRIYELEDYNRLLRKENQELRDCKVEMDQKYLAEIAAMKESVSNNSMRELTNAIRY